MGRWQQQQWLLLSGGYRNGYMVAGIRNQLSALAKNQESADYCRRNVTTMVEEVSGRRT